MDLSVSCLAMAMDISEWCAPITARTGGGDGAGK